MSYKRGGSKCFIGIKTLVHFLFKINDIECHLIHFCQFFRYNLHLTMLSLYLLGGNVFIFRKLGGNVKCGLFIKIKNSAHFTTH
jgi:hypothetical protein